jgi:hypothetical protein
MYLIYIEFVQFVLIFGAVLEEMSTAILDFVKVHQDKMEVKRGSYGFSEVKRQELCFSFFGLC